MLPDKSSNQITIPPGFKPILIQTEFKPEIIAEVEQVKETLLTIGAISSQADAEAANAKLKTAKALLKQGEAERKKITAELDAEKKLIMSMEQNLFGPLEILIKSIDSAIVDFQREELRKKEEERKRIQAEKDAELKKAQEEAERVKKIKDNIINFKINALNACNKATIDTIDELINRLNSAVFKADVFGEFVGEAELVHKELQADFQKRKIDLQKLAEFEKLNKEQAEKLKAVQDAKAEEDRRKAEEEKAQNEIQSAQQLQNEVANIQMGAELKEAILPSAKGVMVRWIFEEDTIDINLLPIEFHTFDKAKIKEAIAQGAREIPGVVIKKDISNVSR